MFDVTIVIGKIEFEKILKAFFPEIMNYCKGCQNDNLLTHLVLELDQDALTILCKILNKIPDDMKQELVYMLLNTYRDRLLIELNKRLRYACGSDFEIQDLYIKKKDNELKIMFKGIYINYKDLLEKEQVQAKLKEIPFSAGNILGKLVKHVPEEWIQSLLQKKRIEEWLLIQVKNVLQKKKLFIEVRSLCFEKIRKDMAAEADRDGGEWEKELVKKLTECVRSVSGICDD